MTESAYHNSSQNNLMAVTEALAATPIAPQTLEQLHAKLRRRGVSKDQVYRTLQNLEAHGWVEKRGGGWAVSPNLSRLSERVRIDLGEIHHKYLAPPEVSLRREPAE